MDSKKGSSSARKSASVLQLIYKHRHQCLKQLLPRLKELNWNDVKDSQDSYGSYPLHYVLFYCTGNGVLAVVQYILQHDPDALYKTTKHQMTPIHIMPGVNFSGDVHKYSLESIQRDQLKARSYMMKKDPSILTHINSFGRLPLSEAVVRGCNRVAKQMLKEYPHLVFEKEANDRIPLYHAIQKENPFATTLLISYYPKSILLNPQMDNPQTFLQMALASPALALPVCQQLEKIMADMFTLHEELMIAQDKLKTATASLRTKNAEAKESAKQIKELRDQLMSNGNGGSAAFTFSEAGVPEAAFASRQEHYWTQTRESEIIFLNNLTQESDDSNGDEPSVEDLKAIANSLVCRLDCYTNADPFTAEAFSRFPAPCKESDDPTSISRSETKTMAQIAAEYCLKHPNPDRSDLYQTIDALNQELMKLEGKDNATGKCVGDEVLKPPSKRLKRSSPQKQATRQKKQPNFEEAVALMMQNDNDDKAGRGAMWL